MRKVIIFCLLICMVATMFTPSIFAEDYPVENRIDKAIEWLIVNQNPEGFWGKVNLQRWWILLK